MKSDYKIHILKNADIETDDFREITEMYWTTENKKEICLSKLTIHLIIIRLC